MLPDLGGSVFTVFAACSLILALSLSAGLPLALHLRDSTDGLASTIYDSAVLGLAWVCLATIPVVHAGAFSIPTVLLVTAIPGLVAAGLVRFFPSVRVHVPALRRPGLVDILVAAVLLMAFALRLGPVNFLPETGDMGEYVNLANEIAAGGNLRDSFPHLFTAFLAIPSLFLGTAATVSALPLVGMLLLAGLLRIGQILVLPRSAVVLVTAAVGVSTSPVWFSTFPVSEALYAALIVFGLTILARIDRRPTWGLVVILGMVGLWLGMLRGNALLLVAPALLGLLVAARGLDQGRWMRHVSAVLAFSAGIAAAYVYNVRYLPGYYIDLQFDIFLPAGLFTRLEQWGLFRFSPQLVASIVVAFGALLGIAWASRRMLLGHSSWPLLRLLIGSVAVAGTAASVLFGSEELRGGLLRAGPLFLALAGLGIVAGIVQGRPDGRTRITLFATSLVAIFSALHAYRLPEQQIHHYFLYWDRYLFSEVAPAGYVLALLGAAWVARQLRGSGHLARLGLGTALVVAGVAALAPNVMQTELALDQRFLGDPHDALTALADATDDPVLPIIWSSSSPSVPRGWYFPNSYRVYAAPLEDSFDRRVLNRPSQPFEDDPVVSPRSLASRLRGLVVEEAYVVEFDDGGPGLPERAGGDASLEITEVDSVIDLVQILPQVEDPEWRSVRAELVVYRVGLGASPMAPASPVSRG